MLSPTVDRLSESCHTCCLPRGVGLTHRFAQLKQMMPAHCMVWRKTPSICNTCLEAALMLEAAWQKWKFLVI